MIKGVLFDLGGTLVSYSNVETVIETILAETKQRKSTKLSTEQLKILYKEARIEVTHNYIGKRFYLHGDLFLDIFKNFTKKAGIDADKEFFRWISERHEYLLIHSFKLIKNAQRALIDLSKKNFIIGVVSNIDHSMLEQILINTKIKHLINFGISSESAQSCKPDRQIFEVAKRKSGLMKSELLFVGDSLEHDIYGSKKYGIQNVLFSERNITAPLQTGKYYEEPNFSIADLSDLSNLIFNLNR